MVACVKRSCLRYRAAQLCRAAGNGLGGYTIPVRYASLDNRYGIISRKVRKDRCRNPFHGLQTFEAWGRYVSEIIARCDATMRLRPICSSGRGYYEFNSRKPSIP